MATGYGHRAVYSQCLVQDRLEHGEGLRARDQLDPSPRSRRLDRADEERGRAVTPTCCDRRVFLMSSAVRLVSRQGWNFAMSSPIVAACLVSSGGASSD